MKSVTPLFGFLGKSGTKLNTPEIGDTKVTVPGVLQPILQIPYPYFKLFTAALGAGEVPVESWIFQAEQLFNVSLGTNFVSLGPGLWNLTIKHRIREAGAVSDPTSTDACQLIDTTTGTTIVLTKISNKQGVGQDQLISIPILVVAEQTYSLNRTTVAGLGTGVNFGDLLVIATRYF